MKTPIPQTHIAFFALAPPPRPGGRAPSPLLSLVPILLMALVGFIFVRRWRPEWFKRNPGLPTGIAKYIVGGLLLGAFVGFLLRPSGMLGQLPLEVVLTRGSALQGFDALLVPLAQQSFNYMLAGGIIGAIALGGAAKYMRPK